MKKLLDRIQRLLEWLDVGLDGLRAPLALGARLYLAQVFFASGLTKIRDWSTTLELFTHEYHVPLLPPGLAAVSGTAGELLLPPLLLLGLLGRIPAIGLFIVNTVAVMALPEIAPAALQQHLFWGALLAMLAVHGSGAWSLDRLWRPKAAA